MQAAAAAQILRQSDETVLGKEIIGPLKHMALRAPAHSAQARSQLVRRRRRKAHVLDCYPRAIVALGADHPEIHVPDNRRCAVVGAAACPIDSSGLFRPFMPGHCDRF